MISVDFAEIETLQRTGKWVESGQMLARAAQSLEAGGADCIVLCTNTMHKVSNFITEAVVSIPFLHIADPTAQAIKAVGLKTIALLGTDFTMSQDFYKGRLVEQHGLKGLSPKMGIVRQYIASFMRSW
jgi:aspartate racemase